MLRETWGAWPWRETLSDKRRLREIQGISRNRGKSEKLWGSIIEFREILLELQRVGLRSNESPNSFSIPKSYLVQRENEKSAGREMRRSIYSLLAWKNVTFLSRIKRNREINIQFLRSGKRCKFQLSDSRCPRCPDKIVQIRVVYYFYSRKRRIFSSCFKLFPSFFFIYLFIYSFLFGGIEEESRQNVLRLRKYLGEENSFLGDALRTIYTRIVESSRLSRIRSIFRRMFHVFYVFLVETSDGNAPGTFPLENRRNYFSKRGKHR